MGSNEEFKRAMVVVAHPDDAEYGCSGSVAEWCMKGWEVVYTLCTDGSKGSDDPNMTTSKLTEIRYSEQKEAAKILGLKKVEFLGYPDAFLESSLDLRKDIVRVIRKHKPDILVCQSPYRSLNTSFPNIQAAVRQSSSVQRLLWVGPTSRSTRFRCQTNF